MTQTLTDLAILDQELSNRHIDLDPAGYFIIFIDQNAQQIRAKHYSNVIDDRGLACDPETGKPIPCNSSIPRQPTRIFHGRTAKEICVQIFEATTPCPVSRLDHASYLGREFQRAEAALINNQEYIQD